MKPERDDRANKRGIPARSPGAPVDARWCDSYLWKSAKGITGESVRSSKNPVIGRRAGTETRRILGRDEGRLSGFNWRRGRAIHRGLGYVDLRMTSLRALGVASENHSRRLGRELLNVTRITR